MRSQATCVWLSGKRGIERMARVAFIGLGVMGFPMAGHLARAGHDVCVYNRSPAKAQSWVADYGGRDAASPAKATEGAEFVMICVGADKDLAAVVSGPDGVLTAAGPGSVIVDHTTVSARISREFAEAAQSRGVAFLDAPVSGGQAGAQSGQLTIMVGGESEAFAKAEPILQGYAKRVGLMGPSGAGQLTKMVNQICIAGLVQGLAEALHFCQEAGLDAEQVLDVISKGAAQSWQMENRGRTMVQGKFDFGFAVDWMRKDLGLVLDQAKTLGVSLPVTALVDQFYADVQRAGGGRLDTSSLIKRFR
jgi:3-hydroxyisobutyrate dehydrogenase